MPTTNNNIRICENNLGELAAAGLSVASFQTSFPVANATSRFRNKQYKSMGNFTIDSNNSAMYIKIGSDQTTVELTADNYNYSTLASHISSQLNTDSSGWTASYDLSGGTYKFSFTCDQNATLLLSETTNAVWDTLGFTGSTDLSNVTFTADEQRNHTNEFIQFDLGYAAEVTSFFCIGSLDEYFSISSDATVLLKANNIDDDWTTPPVSIDLNTYRTDRGIFLFIDSLLSDYGYRFWRFHIEDKSNPLGPEESVKVSHIFLGDYITLENRNIQNGFTKKVVDPTVRQESVAGSLYWDTKTKYTLLESMGYTQIDKDDRETLENLWNRIGTQTPFYISVDPNLQVSKQLDDLTLFCVYNDEPVMQHVIADRFNYSLSFREII